MSKEIKRQFKNIDFAMVARPHTPMYLIHKYWARKPHNVVSEYIKNYTKPGEVVLDPFCGSGPTPIEAIKLGRKAVGFDLNPMANFITRMTATPVDINKVDEIYKDITKKCKKEVEALYKTKCKKCGDYSEIICTHWKGTIPLKIFYNCQKCNRKAEKKADDEDITLNKKIERMKIPFWYPKNKLYYNGNAFLKKEKSETIIDLFTRRNLIALSIIFNSLSKIEDKKIQNVFKLAFTSLSHLASKLTPVRPTRQMSSFWAMHSFWVPPIFMETNVWQLFDSAINGPQGIISGKKDSNKKIQLFKEAKKFGELEDDANIFLKKHNALQLTEALPKNSVDYVFTDPPYGGAIQYFELSTLWASWLRYELDYGDEITVNKNQQKDFAYYHKMLRKSFKEIYQVLKPGKYMTVTFHSTDIAVWNSIIKAVVMVGFDLEKIIYQPPARPSAKGLLQPYGSAVGDYYIRFQKPEKDSLQTEKEIDMNTYEMDVVDSARRILYERSEPTIYQHILNGIMADLQGGRNVPVGAKNIDQVLKDHIGQEFELVPVKDDKGKTIGQKWWLKNIEVSTFNQPTLSDRVERKIIEVLYHNVKVSFDDILQAIFIEFPNALTPETQNVRALLEEYATPSKDGNWMLKPSVRVRESEHSEMIYYLARLGEKAKYDVWIGQREQGEAYGKTKLSTLIVNKPHLWRFTQNAERVKQIDVIWHDRGRVQYEFEVENSTAITEAIVRGANIQGRNIKRIIVIPEEREGLLHRKLKEPLLGENIKKFNWKFIFYGELKKYFEQNRKKDKPDLEALEGLLKMPREAQPKEKQTEMNFEEETEQV
ncbi:hypothetical protein HY768_08105 [candidate division TA06 bacterium]|uniref:DNA methylase N-4/N-6 domain-containing protein n=1 Tax=candidate division TA06 bacterium TaxID=2250710 RepID=A0A933IBY6_UNCT6|nr:hypothetical protein [candidate division TA06 bacterium]